MISSENVLNIFFLQNGIDVPLFDSILLEDLDISNFIGSINFKSLQKCFKVRPLYQSDYEKGKFYLFSMLYIYFKNVKA